MRKIFVSCLMFAAFTGFAAVPPQLPRVTESLQPAIDNHTLAGGTMLVVDREKVLHLGTIGHADIETKKPMRANSVFWIASMTKPVTAVALLMLQDEGKLNVADPVAKYIPEFAALKTPSGQPANLTITQVMTHISGLAEGDATAKSTAHTLADLVPIYLASPMQDEPGARWKYCQSGINIGARIVEIVSGKSFDQFLQERLFDPLGMKDTSFYCDPPAIAEKLVTAYTNQTEPVAALVAYPVKTDIGFKGRPPFGNAGLFSTAPDYGRFCQMLLNRGVLAGKRYLSAEAYRLLTTSQTGDLPTGFLQDEKYGNHGKNYGWGIGTCVLLESHEGVAAMLSPGSFGHGGAWGTQAWIDPVRGVAYILMVQRANAGNGDASEIRRAFQQAAADALK